MSVWAVSGPHHLSDLGGCRASTCLRPVTGLCVSELGVGDDGSFVIVVIVYANRRVPAQSRALPGPFWVIPGHIAVDESG